MTRPGPRRFLMQTPPTFAPAAYIAPKLLRPTPKLGHVNPIVKQMIQELQLHKPGTVPIPDKKAIPRCVECNTRNRPGCGHSTSSARVWTNSKMKVAPVRNAIGWAAQANEKKGAGIATRMRQGLVNNVFSIWDSHFGSKAVNDTGTISKIGSYATTSKKTRAPKNFGVQCAKKTLAGDGA